MFQSRTFFVYFVFAHLFVLQGNNGVAMGYFFVGHDSVTITKNLEVQGTLSTTQGIMVNGAVTANNGLSITSSSPAALSGTLTVDGASTLKSATTVANAPLQVTGGALGTLSVSGATTLSGALGVGGATTLKATTVNAAGLSVTGGAAGTLSVSGAATLSGATSVGGTLGVSGAATLSSTLSVSGGTTLNGDLTCNSCNCANMPVAPVTVTVPGNYATLQAAWYALSGMIVVAPVTINITPGNYVSATHISLAGFTKHQISIFCVGATTVNDCTFSFSGTSGISISVDAFIVFYHGFRVLNTGAMGTTVGLTVAGAKVAISTLGLTVTGFNIAMMFAEKAIFRLTGTITALSCGMYCIYTLDGAHMTATGSATLSGGAQTIFATLKGSVYFALPSGTLSVSAASNTCILTTLNSAFRSDGEVRLANCGYAGLQAVQNSIVQVAGCTAATCVTFLNAATTQYATAVAHQGVIHAVKVSLGSYAFTSTFCTASSYGGVTHLNTRSGQVCTYYAVNTYSTDSCNAGTAGNSCSNTE